MSFSLFSTALAGLMAAESSAPEKPTLPEKRSEILQLIAAPKTVAELVAATGLKKSAVRYILYGMVEDGTATRTEDKYGKILWQAVLN